MIRFTTQMNFRYSSSISTTIMMQFSMCCFTDLQMRQFGNTTRRFTYMVIVGYGCLRVFKHKFPIISGDNTDDMWNVSRFLKWITSSNRACLRKSLCRTLLVLALTTLLETLGMSWVCPVILKLPGVSILVFGFRLVTDLGISDWLVGETVFWGKLILVYGKGCRWFVVVSMLWFLWCFVSFPTKFNESFSRPSFLKWRPLFLKRNALTELLTIHPLSSSTKLNKLLLHAFVKHIF